MPAGSRANRERQRRQDFGFVDGAARQDQTGEAVFSPHPFSDTGRFVSRASNSGAGQGWAKLVGCRRSKEPDRRRREPARGTPGGAGRQKKGDFMAAISCGTASRHAWGIDHLAPGLSRSLEVNGPRRRIGGKRRPAPAGDRQDIRRRRISTT